MKIEMSKEDLKALFGPLGLVPGVEVYGVDNEGKRVEFIAIIIDAKMPKKRKVSKAEEEVLGKMFG